MRCIPFALLLLFSIVHTLLAQPSLSYYLPDGVTYNPAIPVPAAVIEHEVGEWHISHDRLVQYMYALDRASDRISLQVTGHTHEGRPLLLLIITSPKNHQNLEAIRTQHVQLTDPSRSGSLDPRTMPAVFYMGFSIHGNEASGSNAALLVAYHLAAAQGKEIEDYLNNVVILFDPSFNPDGLHRFSSWVNSRKSKAVSADPADMEHNEPWPGGRAGGSPWVGFPAPCRYSPSACRRSQPWPGGRTNHYWFDLNRDWLVAQQPESQARIRIFHEWKPNVLTDHHEMGTNSTFFFQPGVPSRVHPLTPSRNQELTRKIGEYHAKALDQLGSFYYTQEGYDDFYYGKGSTFPDVQGAIGILFEQASSRGHAQESVNGVLKFAFTIRNQFVTALSTLQAVYAMREELLNYQREFFKTALSEAAKDPVKALVFASADKPRAIHLAEVFLQQQIDIYRPVSGLTINGKSFDAESAFIVPLNQPQYRLIKGMIEKRTTFQDSLFYDISTWTLPLAFGVDYEELKSLPALGPKITSLSLPAGKLIGEASQYAYVFEPYGYYVPRAVNRLFQNGIRVKVATEPFFHPSGKRFERGSVLVTVADQEKPSDQIQFLLREITQKDGIDVYAFHTGLDYKGVSLGSNTFLTLRKPEVALLVGEGVNANDAGELWHLLDVRMHMPVTALPVDLLNRTQINRYNTIIFPNGTFSTITESTKERLKAWVQNGGVIIGFDNALNWLNSAGLGKFEMKKAETVADKTPGSRAYADIEEYERAQQSPGAIFETRADLTHPLLYGYTLNRIPVFKDNNLFMENSKNPYGNPLVYTPAPLLSGYISKSNYARLKNSSVAGFTAAGRGRVIGFTDNLAFRAFWLGTNRLIMNALLFGHLLSAEAAR